MNVIEVQDVSKKFRLGATTGDLRERFNGLFSRRTPEQKAQKPDNDFWALRDVSMTVAEGESFGIIGHNGSGKSTLLKLITGIYKPTQGTIRTQGRISALIEVGAGFHPDLTGRENVYMNGSVLGMKKREIDRRFDEIVAFAELEKFIDTPVKRYSSGMYMRLGFAVAAHIDPDIVLVDEVLAVGDESFQAKCMKRMQELRREGKTIVFISHNMNAMVSLCQKLMLLSHGQMLAVGEPGAVISTYRTSVADEQFQRDREKALRDDPDGDGGPDSALGGQWKDMEILDVRLVNGRGQECDKINIGEPLHLECRFRANRRVERPAFGVGLYRRDGLFVFGPNTKFDKVEFGPVEGEGQFRITYESVNLLQDIYHFTVALFHEEDTHNAVDKRIQAASVTVDSHALSFGVVDMPHQWELLAGAGPAWESRVTTEARPPALAAHSAR